MDYETRTTRLVVLRKGTELFDALATTIEIEDESSGEHLVISQSPDEGTQRIKIDPAEWPHIRAAVDKLSGECRA